MAKDQSDSVSKIIKAAYLEFVQKNDEHPTDMYAFCEGIDVSEERFSLEYEDLKGVHSDIWTDIMRHTLTSLAQDAEFEKFSGREQLLAFYYTHVELMKPYRPLILLDRTRMKIPLPVPRFLFGYKEAFTEFARGLISFATDNEEIADRKFLNNQYDKALWSQLYWLIQFWSKDQSEEFELTDAAIEKAVNLSFELTRPGPIDSVIDFAKFVYQNR